SRKRKGMSRQVTLRSVTTGNSWLCAAPSPFEVGSECSSAFFTRPTAYVGPRAINECELCLPYECVSITDRPLQTRPNYVYTIHFTFHNDSHQRDGYPWKRPNRC